VRIFIDFLLARLDIALEHPTPVQTDSAVSD